MVDSRNASIDNLGRPEWRQSFQPETSRLRFTVPELPRLDDLIGLSIDCGHNAHRILNGDLGNAGFGQHQEEFNGLLLFLSSAFEPTRPTDGQVSTRRESNHQIKTISVHESD